MTTSLQLLFDTIDRLKDEGELQSQVAPQIGTHFATTRSGIFFFTDLSRFDPKLQKILKVALSLDRNPVARYLFEHHAPVHEGLVTSPQVWTTICPRADHWHVMAGPILDRGKLVGAVGCTRDRSLPQFGSQDLAELSGICLHLSLWAATNRDRQLVTFSDLLTPREIQIVELVAKGHTNAQIGSELWITEHSVKQALKRMFRKLDVSSRTELVTKVAL
jgi:DNA-binding CsgD family transcriptional regulator